MLLCLLLLWNDWPPKSWTSPQEPFAIQENVFYVGSQELSAYLVVTQQGMAIINVGLQENVPMVLKSIEKLGFNPKDLKLILITQAHADHAGGAASLAEKTGAEIYCGKADLQLMYSGGRNDHVFGDDLTFTPAKSAKPLRHQQVLTLAETQIQIISTPGHTPGSTSYLIEQNQVSLFFQASISLLEDTDFPNEIYPKLDEDFKNTLFKLSAIEADFYLPDHLVFANPKDGSQANAEWFRSRDILHNQITRTHMALVKLMAKELDP